MLFAQEERHKENCLEKIGKSFLELTCFLFEFQTGLI